MKAKKLAELLNGRQYNQEIHLHEEEEAELNGILVIFVDVDGILQVKGFINEEVDCYSGGDYYIDKQEESVYHLEYLQKESNGNVFNVDKYHISAVYRIETNLPHCKFNILKNNTTESVGIVIDIKDLK